jgi:hypothetical protein
VRRADESEMWKRWEINTGDRRGGDKGTKGMKERGK